MASRLPGRPTASRAYDVSARLARWKRWRYRSWEVDDFSRGLSWQGFPVVCGGAIVARRCDLRPLDSLPVLDSGVLARAGLLGALPPRRGAGGVRGGACPGRPIGLACVPRLGPPGAVKVAVSSEWRWTTFHVDCHGRDFPSVWRWLRGGAICDRSTACRCSTSGCWRGLACSCALPPGVEPVGSVGERTRPHALLAHVSPSRASNRRAEAAVVFSL